MRKFLVRALSVLTLVSVLTACEGTRLPHNDTIDLAESAYESEMISDGTITTVITGEATDPPAEKTPVEAPEGKILADFGSYESILMTYRQIALNARDRCLHGSLQKWDDMFVFPNEEAKAQYDSLCTAVSKYTPRFGKSATKEREYAYIYGYALKDLNGDGREELILMTEDYSLIAVYALAADEKTPIKLEIFDGLKRGYIDGNGNVCVIDRPSTVYSAHLAKYAVLENGSFHCLCAFGRDEEFNCYRMDGDTVRYIGVVEYEALLTAEVAHLTQNAAADNTRMLADLTFTRLIEISEDYRRGIVEKLLAALDGTVNVYNRNNDVFGPLANLYFYGGRYTVAEAPGLSYTIVDLDQNGLPELVLKDDYGNTIVLWYYHDEIYAIAYLAGYLDEIRTDGTVVYTVENNVSKSTIQTRYAHMVFYCSRAAALMDECVRIRYVGIDRVEYRINGVTTLEDAYNAYVASVAAEPCTWVTVRSPIPPIETAPPDSGK